MSFIPLNRVVGVAQETTRGTGVSAVYNIEAYDPAPITPARTATQQGVLAGAKSNVAYTHLSKFTGSATLKCDFLSTDDAEAKPNIDPLLVTGGFAYTGAGTANTYLLDGTLPCGALTYTSNEYECGSSAKGRVKQLIGAVPALTIASESVGEPLSITAELTGGMITATADETTIHDYAGLDVGLPLKFIGGSYTLGTGNSVDVQSFSFTTGAEVAPKLDATNTVTNVAYHFIKSLRNRQLTMSIIEPLVSVKDYETEFKAESIYDSVVLSFTNGTSTGRMTLTEVQAVDWSGEDLDSYTALSTTFNVLGTVTIELDY